MKKIILVFKFIEIEVWEDQISEQFVTFFYSGPKVNAIFANKSANGKIVPSNEPKFKLNQNV